MQTAFVTFIIMLLGSVAVSGQGNPQLIDSLKRRNSAYLKEDSIKVELMVNLADALVNTNAAEALKYANEAEELSVKINSPMGKAITYRQKASIFYSKGDYPSSVEYCMKSLKAANDLKKNNNGTTLYIATIYNTLGIIYMEMRAYPKALNNFQSFVANVRKLNNAALRREESIGLLNLSEAYARTKQYKKAIEISAQSLAIAEPDKDYQIAAHVMSTRGTTFVSLNDYKLAAEAFEKGIEYAAKSGDTKIRAQNVGGIADAYLGLKKYELSETKGLEAYTLSKELEVPELRRQLSQLLSYVYIYKQDPAKAVRYLDETLTLKDSLFDTDKKEQIARMEAEYERAKQEAAFQVALEKKQFERNVIAVIAVLVVVSLLIFVVLYRRKARADKLIKTLDARLRLLQSQIQPHFLSNALTAISDFLLRNDSRTADHYLVKFAELMRSILNNTSKTEVPLAEDLDALELYMQLEDIRLDQGFDYQINIDPSIDARKTMILPMLLQPFVENSIWHGLSPQNSKGLITINVMKDGNRMLCTVRDNGIGRDKKVSTTTEDVRLSGMTITKERVVDYGKQKNVPTSVELVDLMQGTEVIIKLPLTINSL